MSEASNWDGAREAELRRLWDAGLSASEIAKTLSASRSAICGKARRIDLARRNPCGPKHVRRKSNSAVVSSLGPNCSSPAADTEAAPSSLAGTRAASFSSGRRGDDARRLTQTLRKLAPTVPECAMVVDVPVEQRVALIDLRPTSCRYPLGDVGSPGFGFCGARSIEDRPYCPQHTLVCTVPRSR